MMSTKKPESIIEPARGDTRDAELLDAYCEWAAARADELRTYAPSGKSDAAINAICDRTKSAERALVLTAPTKLSIFVMKFEALEVMINQAEYDGTPADNRHLLMLASCMADVRRLAALEPV
jgi:hypothetical protein